MILSFNKTIPAGVLRKEDKGRNRETAMMLRQSPRTAQPSNSSGPGEKWLNWGVRFVGRADTFVERLDRRSTKEESRTTGFWPE